MHIFDVIFLDKLSNFSNIKSYFHKRINAALSVIQLSISIYILKHDQNMFDAYV